MKVLYCTYLNQVRYCSTVKLLYCRSRRCLACKGLWNLYSVLRNLLVSEGRFNVGL